MRGFVSIALAIVDPNPGASPREAAVSEQNFRKFRRLMPCRRITS
jgi:hypothetical protein